MEHTYPSPRTDSDHALVAACCAGNKQAFDVLVLRYTHSLSTLARRLLGEHHEAEDLTQETFLRAYEKIEEFRGEAQFSTWLYRICFNLCLNRLRKKKNDLTNKMGVDALAEELLDSRGRLPEQLTMKRERQKLVKGALAEMTPEFREVFLLHNRIDLSYEEIAQRLRLPVGTVRSRLHRGRAQLKERLRPYL
ncbi:MAG: RNA polymerase sigma factor [Terriglobia bacterium]